MKNRIINYTIFWKGIRQTILINRFGVDDIAIGCRWADLLQQSQTEKVQKEALEPQFLQIKKIPIEIHNHPSKCSPTKHK